MCCHVLPASINRSKVGRDDDDSCTTTFASITTAEAFRQSVIGGVDRHIAIVATVIVIAGCKGVGGVAVVIIIIVVVIGRQG